MSKKLYVGNLSYGVSDEELGQLFESYGAVAEAKVITDRDSGRSKGFGFVTMEDGADDAIEALNGQEIKGREVVVNEARPKRDSGNRGGGGYGGGGGRGGYSGGGGGGYGGGRR
ncbi:MAG: RNA-binding protein [Pirellulaceae bacterium]|nr:RNA-binding protein [Pirellulaceae bacterium]